MILRRAAAPDAAALTAFAARTFSDTYAAQNTAEDMRTYLAAAFNIEQQTRELTDPLMVTVVAEADGELVGYAQLKRGNAPAMITGDAPIEIYRFYVDRALHGRGVAQQLMSEALDAARELGARHVWLAVWEKNPRGIAFYMKCGFRDAGTQYFQLGKDRQRDRVLVLAL